MEEVVQQRVTTCGLLLCVQHHLLIGDRVILNRMCVQANIPGPDRTVLSYYLQKGRTLLSVRGSRYLIL